MLYSKSAELLPVLEASLRKDAREHKPRGHLSHFKVSRLSVTLLNKYLAQFCMKFRYALMFTWKPGEEHRIHVDGAPPKKPRHSSLNLLIRGGEQAMFEWYDSEVMKEPLTSTTGIPAYQVCEEMATLRHREPLQRCSWVKTNVPHRVANITTETDLLCIRVQGNPTIEQINFMEALYVACNR